MKKNIKLLLFSMVLILGILFNVKALDESEINVVSNNGNTIASFTNPYASLIDANNALKDFEKYVVKNKGIVVSSKTEKIINEINNEILKSSFVVDDLSKIDEELEKIQNSYDEQATEETKYEVIKGNVDTKETVTITVVYNNGTIGEYSNLIEAMRALNDAESESAEDYVVKGFIVPFDKLVSSENILINEEFDNRLIADAYLLPYILGGYDVSNASVSERVVTTKSEEEKTFNDLASIMAYRSLLELAGYDVDTRLTGLKIKSVKTDETEVDEVFSTLRDQANYLVELGKKYNNLTELRLIDESYNEVTNRDINEIYDTLEEAKEALDNYDRNYILRAGSINKNDGISKKEENIEEYFTSASEAYSYLESQVGTDYTLEDQNVELLGANDITDEIIEKADLNNDDNEYTISYIDLGKFNLTGSTDVTYYDDQGNAKTVSGDVLIESVNGSRTYPLEHYSNNSFVEIKGSISYCTAKNRLGICINTERKEFTSKGIINGDKNESNLSNVFKYKMYNVNIGPNGVDINDNLVNIYKASATKVTESNEPTYTVTGHIYKFERIYRFRVKGVVSNIKLVPEFKIKFIKTKNVTKYNLVGNAKKDTYEKYYRVDFESEKTTRETNISYTQYYTVNQTDYITSYIASGEGLLNLIGEGSGEEVITENTKVTAEVPNTGIQEFNYSLIMLFALISLVGLNIVYKKKNN